MVLSVVEWSGAVWSGIVWCGVVWSRVEWSGLVLCGVVQWDVELWKALERECRNEAWNTASAAPPVCTNSTDGAPLTTTMSRMALSVPTPP